MLQLVSIEQGQTGRGDASRYHPAIDAGDRVKFSFPPPPLPPILCDLTSAGKSSRMLLRQNDGLAMFIRLLTDPNFQVSAHESIFIMVRTLVSGQPGSIDTNRRVSGFNKRQHV